MRVIPDFPHFEPIDLAMGEEICDFCLGLPDGACEFPFAAMYLLRNKYQTQISRLVPDAYALSGVEKRLEKITGQSVFFQFLSRRLPEQQELEGLFSQFPVWKSLPASVHKQIGENLSSRGFQTLEDRDNFDYLYLRSDLAELHGKKFHKKKNLVNAFLASYRAEAKPLAPALVKDALSVLDCWQDWHSGKEKTDYGECKEALEHMELLGLDGVLVYVDDKPTGFSLGEKIAGGTMYCTHFEKGIEGVKGIYQFVNQEAAKQLPETVVYINREQDVGDEGLRQAKMTYRPSGFVEKYLAWRQK
ncbi:MAG: DUF2156 domain-containing protein [Treponema sp.]|jgi:hypothetical protein|nr:DUF2156 domain-containing protein [Treponema sp.]